MGEDGDGREDGGGMERTEEKMEGKDQEKGGERWGRRTMRPWAKM